MSDVIRKFRDTFRDYVPEWLQDRPGLSVGFRTLWGIISPLDAIFEAMFQGWRASIPGENYTASPHIGRTRGIIRGADDTEADYAARLRRWLSIWQEAGRTACYARQIHEVFPGRPRVRVVSRHGTWVTVNADGSESVVYDVPLNWDSLSHPERLDMTKWWSEVWIIIYADPWAYSGTTIGDSNLLTGRLTGVSHLCRQEDVDTMKTILDSFKGAHTYVRAIIWSKDPAAFDPANPGSLPNGRWGGWSIDSGRDTAGFGSRVASPRNSTTTQYWEPF